MGLAADVYRHMSEMKEAWADIRPEPVAATPIQVISVDNLAAAAACYKRRQSRLEHPSGTFDRKKRFFPTESEVCACCRKVREPSSRWPYSLMIHCRSMEHVANLYGVDVKDLRREIRPNKNPPGPKTAWDRFRKAS